MSAVVEQEPAAPPDRSSSRGTARRVADAALSVRAVAALSGGTLGQVGTHLPGGRVTGVRLLDPGADVHVAVHHGEPLTQVADAVRRAVLPVTGAPVDVVIEDVLAPDEVPPPGAGEVAAAEQGQE